MHPLLPLALAMLLAVAEPTTRTTPPMFNQTIMADDGQEFQLKVSVEQASKVPEWDPEAGETPPLSMRVAIQLARDSVTRRYPRFDTFDVVSIETNSIGWTNRTRWFYLVKFMPRVDGNSVRTTGALTMVLMDGTVIEPVLLKK